MSLVLVLLEPRSPIFLGPHGRARKSGALIHSNTLHAALISVAAQHGVQPLDSFNSLRVSSVYPCWYDCLFFPRPFLPLREADAAPVRVEHKRWKSIRLVSAGVLQLWLAKDPALTDRTVLPEPGVALLESERAGRPWPSDGLVREDLSPAVIIDRVTNAATPFDRRCIRVNAAQGGGMYFLADAGAVPVSTLRHILESLGEFGVGGERGVGYGTFGLVDIRELEQPPVGCTPDRATMFMSLSLYLPTEQEVAAGVLEDRAAYDTTVRGGWIHSVAGTALRRRALRMCVEGSVFPKVAAVHGEVRDCAPEGFERNRHPVWRSGLAMPVWFA